MTSPTSTTPPIRPPLSDYERDDRDSQNQVDGLDWALEELRKRRQPANGRGSPPIDNHD